MSPSAPRSPSAPSAALQSVLARIVDATLDPWLPRACALCDLPLHAAGAGLCRHCRLSLPGRDARRCPRCGLRSCSDGTAASGCPACASLVPAFDAALVLADYAPPLDRLITALKFGRQIGLARALGRELARRWPTLGRDHPGLPPVDCLVPVPLAPDRWRERGFNQAAEIARAISAQAGPPVRPLLARARATAAQSSLPRSARLANLADAFAVSGALAATRHVAIVDDVMTSGATMQACAHALRRAGVAAVSVVVAARTP